MFPPSRGVTCLLCNRSVLRRRRITLTRSVFDQHPEVALRFEGRQMLFNNTEHLCCPCWQSSIRNQIDQQEHDDERQGQEPERAGVANQPELPDLNVVQPVNPVNNPDPEIQEADRVDVMDDQLRPSTNVTLRYARPPNTANACIFYQCRRHTRRRIPEHIKLRLLMDFDYFVPDSARVCEFHLEANVGWEELIEAPNLSHSFNAQQVTEIILKVKKGVEGRTRLDFENLEQIDEDELYYWTGRKLQEFLTILNETPSLSTDCDKPQTSLGIMLAKLTTGESNERLALIFHMSRRQLERYMKIARNALTRDYVPRHLRWDHISREEVLQRNRLIPRALFGDSGNNNIIVICDATYVYIYKSSNFLFQVQTYSPHKFLNLLKPFLIVCTDGYIIEVTGPHGAKKNDASIVQDIINNEEHPFHWFFDNGDKFILDRGFRDVATDLEAIGYETYMPKSLNAGERQLTTSQANDSRMVTMCRWVIEVVNGRFKRDYRLFRQEYFHSAMPHMFEDFRIGAALINAFHVPIEDNLLAPTFLQRIEVRNNTENVLAEYVERRRLNRQRLAFQNINAELPALETFPILTEDQLVTLLLEPIR